MRCSARIILSHQIFLATLIDHSSRAHQDPQMGVWMCVLATGLKFKFSQLGYYEKIGHVYKAVPYTMF